MATHNAEVLQEFLVSLGFHLDSVSQKKFDGVMGKVLKSSVSVSRGVIGIAAAAQAMVHVVTYEFEKLYYASKKMGDSAKNLHTYAFGAKQIGIAAEDAHGALEGMAQSIRTNPGMTALFQSLTGDKPSGTVQSMIKLVETLRNKFGGPGSSTYFQGANFAALFGLSEQQYNLLTQPGALEELKSAQNHLNSMYKEAGVDIDSMAKASRDFKNEWRDIEERIGIILGLITRESLPAFKGFNSLLKDALSLEAPWLPDSVRSKGSDQNWRGTASKPIGGVTGAPAPGSKRLYELQATIAAAQYGIPPGIFKSLVNVESGWNPNALGTSGERGLTQLMPGTAKDMGVTDFKNMSTEEQLGKGAKYLSQQYSKFGNWRTALGAYNAGPGNYRAGMGYADKVLRGAGEGNNVTVTASNSITVNTPADPTAVAGAVGKQLDRTTGDIVRTMSGALN